MTREIWPFDANEPATERLVWATDLFRAKAGEQRTAMRDAPRRLFNYEHFLSDQEYSSARALVREAQGSDGFWVPDWAQSVELGALTQGIDVTIPVSLSDYDFGDEAIIWESLRKFERVSLQAGNTEITTLLSDYDAARIAPLWPGNIVGGLSADRIGTSKNRVSLEFQLSESRNIAATTYTQYRSLDVLPMQPVLGGGPLPDAIEWPVSTFDNVQSNAEFIRTRAIPDYTFTMRWHYVDRTDIHAITQWLHTLRGRQKSFWFSSFSHDLEPAASVSGTTLTVFEMPGFSGVGHTDPFDIEIKDTSGSLSYRRVTAATAGTAVGGIPTLDLTIDSSLTLDLANIERISFLRCSRLNTDTISIQHLAVAGSIIQVSCIEIPEP